MAPKDELDNLQERIDSNPEIHEKDRQVLLKFDDAMTLLRSDYSDHRHLKLLRHVVIIAEEVGGLAAALEDRPTAEDIVRWINRTYDNEETNRDYRVALKAFGRRVSDENGDGPPDSLDWISSGTPRNYDPPPDPADIFDWKVDILPMINETENPCDAAAIGHQFDAGLRGWEFWNLMVGMRLITNTAPGHCRLEARKENGHSHPLGPVRPTVAL